MENSIEEDMEIVENYLADSAINETDSDFFKNGGWEIVDLKIPKSMQHILSDYKKLQEEFKQVDHECERLEEKEVRLIKENEELKSNSNDSVVAIKLYSLQKDNEQLSAEVNSLKENNEALLELANNKQWISPCYVAQNYISKQKIKDKIEELKKNPLKIKQNGKYYYETSAYNKIIISALQELLEK